MKSSVFLIAFCCFGVLACAQTSTSSQTPPATHSLTPSSQTPSPSTTAPSTGLKVRGPDAVAQQDPNKVVATINGHQITAKEAAALLKQVPDDQRRSATNLASLLERVYMIDQFADRAEKLKLDQQNPWKERIELQRTQILAQAYINQVATNTSSAPGDAAKQYYDAHQPDFQQIKLSGILIAFNPPGTPATGAATSRTESDAEQKANDVEKKIKDGGDFSALARTESDQQQSAVRGGELGTFTMGDPNLPPEVKTAVAKLQPNQVSEPIRVPSGYIILKLDSRKLVPYDQARASILQRLEVEKYKIQVQDPDFFASTTPTSNIPSLQRPASATPAPLKPQGR